MREHLKQQPITKRERAAILLAAGSGTRLRRDLGLEINKTALLDAKGRSIISRGVDLAQTMAGTVAVVIGGDNQPDTFPQTVKASLKGRGILYARTNANDPTRGTGTSYEHGVRRLKETQRPLKTLIVGNGDSMMNVPPEAFRQLVTSMEEQGASMALLTAIEPNPGQSSAGRIMRDKKGNVTQIGETKDITPEQREQLAEINLGLYCLAWTTALEQLGTLPLSETTHEMYITSLVSNIAQDGGRVITHSIPMGDVGRDVNTGADYAAFLERSRTSA